MLSANAVRQYLARIDAAERDARSFGRTRVGAVGPSTAEELARHGIKADLIPVEHTGEALVTALRRGTGRVLVPRVAGAPEKLVEQLKNNGWKCEVVVAYVNLPATDDSLEAEQL